MKLPSSFAVVLLSSACSDPSVQGGAPAGNDAAVANLDADAAAPADAGDAARDPFATFAAKAATAICAKLTACCEDAEYLDFFRPYTTFPYDIPEGTAPPKEACVTTLTKQLEIIHDAWRPSYAQGHIRFDDERAAECVAAVESAACGLPVAMALNDKSCFDSQQSTVIRRVAPLGTPCTDLNDTTFVGHCDPALGYCDGPPDAIPPGERRCVAWRRPGDSCPLTERWNFCDLFARSGCRDATPSKPGVCSDPKQEEILPLGAVCDNRDDHLQCAPGSYCDSFSDQPTNVCVPLVADGQPCSEDGVCKTQRPKSCHARGGKQKVCGNQEWCSGRGR
jgi:hypothetical protein